MQLKFRNWLVSLDGHLAVLVTVGLACLWLILGVGMRYAHDAAEASHRRELTNLSWAFAKTVQTAVETIDLSAIDLREHWLEDREDFARVVRQQQQYLEKDVAFQVSIIGADGRLVFSSLDPGASLIDLSDREHFSVHKNRHSDELFVSQPVLGRISNRWSIQFTRPIFDSRLQFQGVIVLSVATDHFTRYYATINFERDSVSSLLNHAGHIIARWPATPQAIGRYIGQDYFSTLAQGADMGWMERASPVDGMQRLLVWRKVEGKDLFVLLGISVDAMYQGYRDQRNVLLLLGAGLSALVLFFAALFGRNLKRVASANAQLKESEERWSFALEGGGDGVWDWDLRSNQVVRSRRWLEILGLQGKALSGDNEEWLGRLHPLDKPHVQQVVQEHLAGRSERYELEYRLRSANGDWKWVLDRGMVIRRGSAGQPLRLIGTISDFTQRHEQQQQLLDSQRFLRSMTNALPSLVGYWRPDLSCAFANQAYQSAFSRTPQELDGISLRELLGDALLKQYAAHFEAALSGEVREFEVTQTQADGSTRCHWVQCLPDRVGGEVKGVFSLSTDVSALKAAQVHLEQANHKLTQRTLEADQANQAKSSFLASMSHEIRTPMNSIVGMTELALLSHPDTPVRQHLEVVKNSAGALLGIINEILEFSKIEAGKLTLERVQFELAQLVHDTVTPLAVMANQKSIPIHVAIEAQVPAVMQGDSTRLRQVLNNLLGNAIKFTHRGQIALTVTLQRRHEQSAVLLFSVQDSGIGIEPARQVDIFSAFAQEGPLTAKTYGGTGLGLSISRRLVHLMRGEMWVHSKPTQGSTFYFTVELDLCSHSPALPEPPAPAQARTAAAGAGLEVLLVEDYPANQTYAMGLLSYLGHHVTLAQHGQEAIALAAQRRFDVILMDLQMPVMDGLEATTHIRAGEAQRRQARVPIIAMTAVALRSEVERCYAAGMDDFVSKPFTPDDLNRALAGCAAAAPGR